MQWLLVLCVGWFYSGVPQCVNKGGVTAIHTTEVQCKAALNSPLGRSNTWNKTIGFCVSPTGEITSSTKEN